MGLARAGFENLATDGPKNIVEYLFFRNLIFNGNRIRI